MVFFRPDGSLSRGFELFLWVAVISLAAAAIFWDGPWWLRAFGGGLAMIGWYDLGAHRGVRLERARLTANGHHGEPPAP